MAPDRNAERSLWDITTPDGADRRFRAAQFSKLPDKFRGPVAEQYRRRFEESGIPAANEFLRETVDKLQGPAVRLASSDEDLCRWAASRAQEFARAAARAGDKETAFLALSEAAKRRGIAPPELVRGRTIEGAIERLSCEQWWRGRVRKYHARRTEGVAIELGLVHDRAGLYVSDESVSRRREQRSRNRRILEAMLAVNELGESFSLAELADMSISNPSIRRGELMTRLAGFEEAAERLGHVADLWTITCPSRMHARHRRSGERNESYDGTLPDAAQKYLRRQWERARAKFRRQGIRLYGFRVAEPHHDGTPHWHVLVFMPPSQRHNARRIMRHYALQVDGNEKGAALHRFKVLEIDRSKGTAAGYLAKYVAKNIDGCGIDRVDEDLTGRRDARQCADRVDAWASIWGIRQFQQLGGPPVGVWRELRRLRDELQQEVIEAARFAADNAQWGRFVDLMGGPLVARRDMPIRLATAAARTPGRYSDSNRCRIVGLECEGVVTPSRLHEWITMRIAVPGRTDAAGSPSKGGNAKHLRLDAGEACGEGEALDRTPGAGAYAAHYDGGECWRYAPQWVMPAKTI